MRPYPLNKALISLINPFPLHLSPSSVFSLYPCCIQSSTLFLHISLFLSILFCGTPYLQSEAPKSFLCHYLQWPAPYFLNLSGASICPFLVFSGGTFYFYTSPVYCHPLSMQSSYHLCNTTTILTRNWSSLQGPVNMSCDSAQGPINIQLSPFTARWLEIFF